jgi:adenylyltransferase/sulfurtransferase
MTARDYQLINLKYSCPLLKREDIAEGKVPTAPTISSMIAGLQTQEALKILHGMAVKPGTAMVFNGESNSFYHTAYQRKESCLSHETYGARIDVPLGAGDAVESLFEATGGSRLHLDRDLVVDLTCACGKRKDVLRPLARVTLKEGTCACGGVMKPTITHTVERGTPLAKRTLREAGVAPFDVVKVETPTSGLYARLAKDGPAMMAWG